MMEDRIEHEIVTTSVVTFSKPSEFSCAELCYVVALFFFSSNELVKFFTSSSGFPSIFSFSKCVELFLGFWSYLCWP